MPKANVTMKAVWEKTTPPSVDKYTVTMATNVNAEFKIVEPANGTSFAKGTVVKFTVTAKTGFKVTAVKNGTETLTAGQDGKYSVTVGEANIVITVETEPTATPPATTYTVTVTGDHVTATFDEQGPYAEGKVVKFTLTVDSGYEIVSVKNGDVDVPKGEDNKYSVTVAKENITITVETEPEADPLEIPYGGESDSMDKWVVWNAENADGVEAKFTDDEKKNISLKFNGKGDSDYGVQLFYNNSECVVNTQYTVSFSITSNKALTINFNGQVYELTANEATEVSVTRPYAPQLEDPNNTWQGKSLFSMQIHTTTALGATELTISDITWEEYHAKFDVTGAKVAADESSAYLVISGTYQNYEVSALEDELKKVSIDLQEVDLAWNAVNFPSEAKTVTVNGDAKTWEFKVDLKNVPVHTKPYTGHFSGNLKLPAAQAQDGQSVTFGGKTYTLVNKAGSTEKEDNYGCVSVMVSNVRSDTAKNYVVDEYTDNFIKATVRADEQDAYLDLTLTLAEATDGQTGYTLEQLKALKLGNVSGDSKTLFTCVAGEEVDGGVKLSYKVTNFRGKELYLNFYESESALLRSFEGKDHDKTAVTPVAVNGIEYSVTYHNEWFSILLNAKLTDSVKIAVEKSELKVEGDKALYVVTLTATGADKDALQQDLTFGNSAGDHSVYKIDEAEGKFTVSFDVTAITGDWVWAHLYYNGVAFDGNNGDIKTGTDGTSITVGVKKYNLRNKEGSDNGGTWSVDVLYAETLTPTITFDKNGATEGDDPEITLGEPQGGVYKVTLPDNTFTAPDNTYFRGWDVNGVVYFPGEKLDVEPTATVTLKAVWEELYEAYEQDVTISHTWTNAVNVVVANGAPAAELTATVSDSATLSATTDAWHGILVDINMTIKGATEANFIRLRVDGFIFAFKDDATNIGQIGKDVSKWDAAKYVALFANGGKAVQRVTASLSGRVLTYTIATYAADTTDFTTAQPVVSVTYNVESAVDVAALTLAFYHDDGVKSVDGVDQPNNTFKLENAKVKNYISYSANQAPTAQAPITVGTADNAMAYSGNAPAWTTNLKKGEKVVLKGTMTSVANATTAGNYNAMLAYLYSGVSPVAAIRSDNFIVDGQKMLDAEEMTVQQTPAVESEKHEAASGIQDDTALWASMRAIIANCTAELTFDYTDASKIVITFVYTGDENKFTQTFTFTAAAEKTLKDEYKIGIGGDHNYTVINSLVRTSVKAAD